MTYDELKKAIEETEEILRQSEYLASQTIKFACGKLKNLHHRYYKGISNTDLDALKRELKFWDMNKKIWK